MFAKGVSRPTVFGRETIVVEPGKTEQFFTVEESQGLRSWQWNLRTGGLKPRLTRNGAVEFAAANRLGGSSTTSATQRDSNRSSAFSPRVVEAGPYGQAVGKGDR
jgi:hypothetical protein